MSAKKIYTVAFEVKTEDENFKTYIIGLLDRFFRLYNLDARIINIFKHDFRKEAQK